MPFGLCNAPSTFQRLMQKILRGFDSYCSVYIDDILVFSESVEEHLHHLSQIFERIESFGLKLHPSKCSLGQPEVLFLGHVVSREGLSPDPAKVNAVKDFPVPTNVRSVRVCWACKLLSQICAQFCSGCWPTAHANTL